MRLHLACTVLLLSACGLKQDGDGSGTGTAGSSTSGGLTSSSSSTTSGATTDAPTSTGVDTTHEATGGTTGGPGVCPDPNSHQSDGECFCDPGFDWCDREDPEDLSCCTFGSTSGEATSTGDGDTTGAPQDCAVAPPPTCDAELEQFFCDQDEACGPAGSTFYQCENGGWVPAPEVPGASCAADGFDFAYGCVATDASVQFLCGDGPGTPCDDDDIDLCADVTTLHFCTHGKLGAIDCAKQCQEVGDDMGITHDSGFCAMKRTETSCSCCDEPDCPR